MALPRVVPRVIGLFFSGFSALAYFIALTYALVRLLPEHHPYLDERNIGKYGIRHVIAAAAHRLTFHWKNIDQILIFFAVMAGTLGMLMFVIALAAFITVSPVYAMNYFTTSAPTTDIAFMMLDKVFGIPGMFNSEVATNAAKYGPFPNNFHVALTSLFQFYSMGLFLLCIFVFLYYIVVIITETAVTGIPFAQRFDNFWIPLRLIIGLALLMPGFGGLSTAQYIVLYAAKLGSGLATNAWISYNFYAGDNPAGLTNTDLVTRPALPDYSQLIKDLILIRGCMEMNMAGAFFLVPLAAPESFYGVTEYMVKGGTAAAGSTPTPGAGISEALLDVPAGFAPRTPPRSPVAIALGVPFTIQYDNMTTFNKALNFYDGGNIRLVLGTYHDTVYKDQEGYVYPHCGEIVIPVTAHTPEALYVAEGYLAAVVRILYTIGRSTATNDPQNDINEVAMSIASARYFYQTSNSWRKYVQQQYGRDARCYFDSDNDQIDEFPRGGTALPILGKCTEPIPASYWRQAISLYQEAFEWAVLTGYDHLTGAVMRDPDFALSGDVYYQTTGVANPLLMNGQILRYGWGGAGLWYNKIAQVNGSLMNAVGAAPYIIKYPAAMEKIKEQRLKSDSKVDTSGCEIYNPRKAGETSIDIPDSRSAFFAESAVALYNLCKDIHGNEQIRPVTKDSGNFDVSYGRNEKSSSMILNAINAMFGGSTFFNILENKTTNPMSMLTTLGKTLIDKAVFNFAAATGTSIVGGLNQMAGGQDNVGFAHLTIAASQFSNAFVALGSLALVSGFMLFYVIPMMPFLYFFFAVGTWVKSIFEAMLGVPLWAIAHLNLKGPGISGPGANIGYYMILEIFIRPTLVVFALIGSFSIFTAMVIVLNTTFDLALSNIFGSDIKAVVDSSNGYANASLVQKISNIRGIFDQFMFTLIYIMLVYIIGMSCFKLIDLIPDNIMRWSGVGVKTWGGIMLYGGGDNAGELLGQMPEKLSKRANDIVDNTLIPVLTAPGNIAAQDAADVIRQAAQKKKPETPSEKDIKKQKDAARSSPPSEATRDSNTDKPDDNSAQSQADKDKDDTASSGQGSQDKQNSADPNDPIKSKRDPGTGAGAATAGTGAAGAAAAAAAAAKDPAKAARDLLTGQTKPKQDPITTRPQQSQTPQQPVRPGQTPDPNKKGPKK